MKLFTNGCSFTWGGEILENVFNIPREYMPELGHVTDHHNTFRQENVWSYHLSKSLNASELVNLSISSGSNQRIVRTTLDFFIDKINNNYSCEDYVAVIQWTDPSRYEVYHTELKKYLLIKESNILPVIDSKESDMLKYRFFFDSRTFYDEWFVHLVCLSNFFENHKIRYLFCTMNELVLPSKYFTDMVWLGNDSKSNQIFQGPNFRYKGKHPDLHGHKIIAKRLYDRLKVLYNV